MVALGIFPPPCAEVCMISRRISAWGSCILLVSLGLGILYLVTVERLSVAEALGFLLAAAVLVPLVLPANLRARRDR